MTLAATHAPGGTRRLTLGIMQPYFFPHLGYFDLISRSDRWVVFDVAQYRPKSWMNRNRVLHPTAGWQYVTVPVRRQGRESAIRDVLLLDGAAAGRRVLGQLAHYRRDAPFYRAVTERVGEAFARTRRGTLTELNVHGLATICEYLGVGFDHDVCSELGLPLPAIEHAGQWALEISALLEATDYVNPAGGRELFRPEEFADRGIGLHFAEPLARRYGCGRRDFVENLSIIDVLMWNDPATVRSWLGRAAG